MDTANLTISWTDYTSVNLNARIESIKADRHIILDRHVEAIQFLRGVSSRASLILPALYNQLGARSAAQNGTNPYWRTVQATSLEFSSLQTISFICRSVFDDSKKGITGKKFATISDNTLQSVANYWGDKTKRSTEEASKALVLLREVLRRCARQPKLLFDGATVLERRIGLLKLHANREAAHLSLEPYLFDVLDLIHVVAAITVVGAMIYDFDSGTQETGYFDKIDEGGWQAASCSRLEAHVRPPP